VREALLPIQEAWRSAEEMSQQSLRDRGISSDLIHCKAGGGQMGSNLCHANEAPFPEKLAEFFVRSFAPENGIVIDPFSGSGTTAAVAVRWGRRALCCDLRQSQVELSRRRIKEAEPGLFTQRAEGE
jgi:DNA modification methylase